MKSGGLTSVSLRIALSLLAVVLCGLIGVGFYFAQNYLVSFAADVSQTVARSQSGGSDTQSLQTLEDQLNELQGATIKAANLTIEKSQYETRIINDLNTYASRSGIKILNYTFSASTAIKTPVSASNNVTIKIETPVAYIKLINFMGFIESSLPKMQISSLTISRGSGSGTGMVNVSDIIIGVQTR